MGCDIHLYAERREGKEWKTLDKWSDNPDYDPSNPNSGERQKEVNWRNGEDHSFYTGGRSYNLFTALAGVRNYFENKPPIVSEPKGFPQDSCPETKEEYEAWDSDAHTPSWLSLRELEEFDWSSYGETCNDFRSEVIPKLKAAAKQYNITSDDVRIVFFFDN